MEGVSTLKASNHNRDEKYLKYARNFRMNERFLATKTSEFQMKRDNESLKKLGMQK